MSNVTLIREGNRQTEQTFAMGITVGTPAGTTRPATLLTDDPDLSYDYRIVSPGSFLQDCDLPTKSGEYYVHFLLEQ